MYRRQAHTHRLPQRQTLNMVTCNVAKKNVLYFIKTFLTQYLSSVMSENKGILGNSHLMMVSTLWIVRSIWRGVQSCAPTR